MGLKKEGKFVCQSCGYSISKWEGKCPSCKEWNTFLEEELDTRQIIGQSELKNLPKTLDQISQSSSEKIKTGIREFDRVMGNGITKSSLTLIGGQPGVGKSTLLLKVMGALADQGRKILYISGEECDSQIADRAKRLGIMSKNLFIMGENNWEKIVGGYHRIKPEFLIIDSIQTTVAQDIGASPGSLSQIREMTYEILNLTKSLGPTSFIVGHITKDGGIAGPKLLEHMVDTVVYFEGDQFGDLRLLRASKNRFGNTNELGIFEMSSKGLKEIGDSVQCLLDDGQKESIGQTRCCSMKGSRPIFLESQALVVENKYGPGKRVTQGGDGNRLLLLIALIEKRLGISLGSHDIYLNIPGGRQVLSRDLDLGTVVAILSSYHSKVIPNSTVFLGELTLNGEIRSVSKIEQRLKQIESLKYKKIFLSKKHASKFNRKVNIELIGLENIEELNAYLA
jgi:DNA repair protein RadA/Sms